MERKVSNGQRAMSNEQRRCTAKTAAMRLHAVSSLPAAISPHCRVNPDQFVAAPVVLSMERGSSLFFPILPVPSPPFL